MAGSQAERFEHFVQGTFNVSRARAAEVVQRIDDFIANTPELAKLELRASAAPSEVDALFRQVGTVMTPAIYTPVAGGIVTMLGLPAIGIASPLMVALMTLLVFAFLAHNYSMPLVDDWIHRALEPISTALP